MCRYGLLQCNAGATRFAERRGALSKSRGKRVAVGEPYFSTSAEILPDVAHLCCQADETLPGVCEGFGARKGAAC